jgi:hypothetical protein
MNRTTERVMGWVPAILGWVALATIAGMFYGLGWHADAQDKPAAPAPPAAVAPDVPQLKPEVALELRNAQWEQAKVAFQMQNDNAAVQNGVRAQQELPQLSQANQQLTEKLLGLQAAALKKSGIDPDKFTLNPDTLTVEPKPIAAPAAAPTKP